MALVANQTVSIMKLGELTNLCYSEQRLLNEFFERCPTFRNAEILNEPFVNNFEADYWFDEQWVVQIKNKKYNVIVATGRGNNWRGRKCTDGVKVKKISEPGQKRIRRVRQKNYQFEHTKASVQCQRSLNKDCQIWTLAKCLGKTYDEAYFLLSANGWTVKCVGNIYTNRWNEIFKAHGHDLIQIWGKRAFQPKNIQGLAGTTLGNVTKFIPKTGIFVVQTTGHISCVIDGVIYDSAFEPGRHVFGIWSVNSIL